MKYLEYGAENSEIIILLHGGGFSAWNYRKEAELLKDRYHVILPFIDGHAGSDRDFVSVEQCAENLIRFIDENCSGKILLLGGLSLGAQIVCEVLAQRKDICRYAIIESASVIPDKLTGALVGPSFSSSYGLIRSRKFSKMQFDYYKLDQEFFEEYYRDTCLIKKENLIAFTKASAVYQMKDTISACKAKVLIAAGAKEQKIILKSADLLHEAIENSELKLLENMIHGQFSMNHPDLYTQELLNLIQK